jgi:hypothetical protein
MVQFGFIYVRDNVPLTILPQNALTGYSIWTTSIALTSA